MSALKQHYHEQTRLELKKQFAFKSIMQSPRVEKVVLNMCVPEAVKNSKILKGVAEDLSMIAGQKSSDHKS